MENNKDFSTFIDHYIYCSMKITPFKYIRRQIGNKVFWYVVDHNFYHMLKNAPKSYLRKRYGVIEFKEERQ